MATYGSTPRRGLPRVAGGEPWPPASSVPSGAAGVPGAGAADPLGETQESGRGVSVPHQRQESEAPSRNEGTAVAEAAPAVAAGADGADAAAAADGASNAAAGPARTIRRGLPRVPGGEPWPPASFSSPPAASRPVAASAAPASVAAAAAPGGGDGDIVAHGREEPEAPSRDGGAVAATAGIDGVVVPAVGGPVPTAAESAAGTDAPTLRRGLPRVAGGEPWPPASFVPRRPVVGVAEASAAPRSDAAEAATTASMSATGTAATPTGTATAVTAPVAAPAAPVTAPSAAAVTAPSAAAGPLPFVPTVFPTASSKRWDALRAERVGKGPLPAVEPARIGPFTRAQWAGAVVVGGLGLLFVVGMLVLAVRWLVSLGFLQDFLATYPGEYHLPDGAPVGLPAWIGWQHFFNVFLMVLIIRSGLQVRREKRPAAFWSPRRNKKRKISLNLWFHQALDILWLVNGVVFVVLLFVTGQWMRIVPTSWEVFPNALSAALQYASLDWPTENGWVNYNALQQLAYFATVFLAAPLAAVTGVRMSGVWPKNAKALNKAYPVEWARAVHFPVMIYFVLFIVVHVTLVLATGALRNLNHMYAAQDAVNWAGFWIFAGSLVVIAGGWVAARPLVLAPIARLFGTVSSR
ncbi:cytochrome b/b6 domain-containing protein [Microbacterium sp. SORGH_AS_0888]|uniref:cytochrome b/b6 domain-containing protein n=1 Tax=Microbacterium sp. SORGH_AS_0888 TaxID=3041791 RepID=UPI002787C3D8|nr:cytochrome b/b6 domain-containing protein [Microbacterium sp. SORGH_AS_0888]MDQ1129494.1 thiosulfate reductase cytochrome b subunit [Microbacterium sp. SORGH_AS_0888]